MVAQVYLIQLLEVQLLTQVAEVALVAIPLAVAVQVAAVLVLVESLRQELRILAAEAVLVKRQALALAVQALS